MTTNVFRAAMTKDVAFSRGQDVKALALIIIISDSLQESKFF